MNRLYVVFAIFLCAFFMVSFASNPPDGKTGAPGDSLCIECHTQGNPPINGTISVEGFPASITPGEKYMLTVVNRNTVGDAVRGGFQMTILGPLNTKAGTMSNPSSSSKVTSFNGREYFEHNPSKVYPDSNVVKWTVDWTAPQMSSGSVITWYVAGNIANGNLNETGDRIVAENGSGAIVLSSVQPLESVQPVLYPNPGYDEIRIIIANEELAAGEVIFYNIAGARVGHSDICEGVVKAPDVLPGMYLLEIKQENTIYLGRWTKL